MKIDPWIPAFLAIAMFATGGLMILFIPETLHTKPPTDTDTSDSEPDTPEGTTSFTSSIRSRISHMLSDLRQSASLIHSYPVVALLATFLTAGSHGRSLEFAPQYLSKTLGWSLSEAGMLLSVHVALNIALYVFILPSLSRLLTLPDMPFRFKPIIKDLFLARASGVAISLGALLLALPSVFTAVTGLMVFTLGMGFSTLCRVVITPLVDSSQTARLYTLISVLMGCGELVSGPAMAWLFKVGMGMGDGMAGLPFLAVAGACTISVVLTFTVRGSTLIKAGEEEEEEEEERLI